VTDLPDEICWFHGLLTLRPTVRGFDDAKLIDVEPVLGTRAASTPATRERYAVLRSKRVGDVWQEGRRLYRKGPNGVTVFDSSKWAGAAPE